MKRIATLLLTLLVAAAANAATVRGKIIRADGSVARGAAVTLDHPQRGRSATAYSDAEGMFYLPNVPAGDYTMEVQTPNDKAAFRITVLNQEYSDVAPVKVK